MAEELPIRLFADPGELEAWLEESHDSSAGVWLKIAKKGSGERSVTYAEALELALCFGWIDSQKRGLDEAFFLQRFTPRRPRGRWSKINREKAEALIAAARMRPGRARRGGGGESRRPLGGRLRGPAHRRGPAGPAARARRQPGRRASSSPASTAPTATRSSIASNEAKKPETRERRLRKFLAMLERGEKIHGP